MKFLQEGHNNCAEFILERLVGNLATRICPAQTRNYGEVNLVTM